MHQNSDGDWVEDYDRESTIREQGSEFLFYLYDEEAKLVRYGKRRTLQAAQAATSDWEKFGRIPAFSD